MSGDLAFNGFSQAPSERTRALRTVLRILCRSFSVYLRTGGLTAGGLIEVLSWIDFGGGENPSEVRSLQECPRPRIEVILIVGVEQSES